MSSRLKKTPNIDQNHSRGSKWFFAGLIGLVSLVYAEVYRFEFVNYDDDVHVYDNAFVNTGITRQNIVWAMGIHGPSQWHPLAWLSHQLDCTVWGLDAGWHHLVNLGLHLGAVSCLLFALNRLFERSDFNLFIAAVFALHPLNVESVAWVAERRNVLCGLFWMGGLIAYESYARRGGWLRYGNVLLMTALALMSKPMAVTLPCVFCLMDYWPLRRMPLPETWFTASEPTSNADSEAKRYRVETWTRIAVEKIPLMVMVGISAWLSVLCQQSIGVVSSLTALPLHIRIENSLVAYGLYLKRFFWPSGLAVFYLHPGLNQADADQILFWPAIGWGIVLCALTGIAVWNMRRRPMVFIGWLWFLGVLVPMIGLVQVGEQQMADRYVYLAIIGLAIALVGLIPAQLSSRKTHVLRGLSVIVLCCWSLMSWLQLGYWQNSETLFARALETTRPNSVAHINYGMALKSRGDLVGAVEHYGEAIRLQPHSGLAWYNLGVLYHEIQNIPEAIKCLEQAVKFKPLDIDFRIRLGGARGHAGDLAGAIREFEEALHLNPASTQAHFNLGVIHEALGRTQDATSHYQKVLEITPDEPTIQAKLKQLRGS
ncbi:MAG: tetratricopeptide repeat protein [Planctomycetaceae bacterium]